ncbi:MAG: hypothetical protein IPJ65_42230 [Archangiaceae bacterium]|nr:hypothetical protein [Archangiaceae bacterium]
MISEPESLASNLVAGLRARRQAKAGRAADRASEPSAPRRSETSTSVETAKALAHATSTFARATARGVQLTLLPAERTLQFLWREKMLLGAAGVAAAGTSLFFSPDLNEKVSAAGVQFIDDHAPALFSGLSDVNSELTHGNPEQGYLARITEDAQQSGAESLDRAMADAEKQIESRRRGG